MQRMLILLCVGTSQETVQTSHHKFLYQSYRMEPLCQRVRASKEVEWTYVGFISCINPHMNSVD